MMLEKQRLTYLEHLGVSHYVPRRILPFAAPSQLLADELLQDPAAFSTADVPALVNDTSDVSGGFQSTGAVQPKVSSSSSSSPSSLSNLALENESLANNTPSLVESLLTGAGSGASSESQKTVIEADSSAQVKHAVDEALNSSIDSTSNPSVAGSADKPLTFSLNVWRIHQEWLVIDSRQPAAALPTDRLLQNILRSVGVPLAQLPQSEILRWPMFTNPVFSHSNTQPEADAAEARAMVQAYIAAQCSKQPVKGVLLLGDEAVRFALASNENADDYFETHQGHMIEQTQWNSIAVIAPSLVDMLNEPLKKHITWQALQAFLQQRALVDDVESV